MPTDTIPVFDAATLNHASNGDPAMQVEMLALFVAEVERLVRQVEDAEDPHLRGDRLRALFRVARNIGAMMLAQEARAIETQITDEQPDLGSLKDAVAATLAYVRQTGI